MEYWVVNAGDGSTLEVRLDPVTEDHTWDASLGRLVSHFPISGWVFDVREGRVWACRKLETCTLADVQHDEIENLVATVQQIFSERMQDIQDFIQIRLDMEA